MKSFDVDIDVKTNNNKEVYGIRASIYDSTKEELRPHPSGIYVDTNIPVDQETGLAAIDYEEAEKFGFIKIDLLTNTSYTIFNNKQEVLDAIGKEPNWDLMLDEKFVNTLPHLSGNFELVQLLEPKSIEDIADILALIRPGKQHLLQNYIDNPEVTRDNLYRKPVDNNKYYLKRSHAIAYAMMIVGVMNAKNSLNGIIF